MINHIFLTTSTDAAAYDARIWKHDDGLWYANVSNPDTDFKENCAAGVASPEAALKAILDTIALIEKPTQ